MLPKNKVKNWLNFQGPTQFCEIELEGMKTYDLHEKPCFFSHFLLAVGP